MSNRYTTVAATVERQTVKAYLFFFLEAEESRWVPKGKVDDVDTDAGTADIETTFLRDLEVVDEDELD